MMPKIRLWTVVVILLGAVLYSLWNYNRHLPTDSDNFLMSQTIDEQWDGKEDGVIPANTLEQEITWYKYINQEYRFTLNLPSSYTVSSGNENHVAVSIRKGANHTSLFVIINPISDDTPYKGQPDELVESIDTQWSYYNNHGDFADAFVNESGDQRFEVVIGDENEENSTLKQILESWNFVDLEDDKSDQVDYFAQQVMDSHNKWRGAITTANIMADDLIQVCVDANNGAMDTCDWFEYWTNNRTGKWEMFASFSAGQEGPSGCEYWIKERVGKGMNCEEYDGEKWIESVVDY